MLSADSAAGALVFAEALFSASLTAVKPIAMTERVSNPTTAIAATFAFINLESRLVVGHRIREWAARQFYNAWDTIATVSLPIGAAGRVF